MLSGKYMTKEEQKCIWLRGLKLPVLADNCSSWKSLRATLLFSLNRDQTDVGKTIEFCRPSISFLKKKKKKILEVSPCLPAIHLLLLNLNARASLWPGRLSHPWVMTPPGLGYVPANAAWNGLVSSALLPNGGCSILWSALAFICCILALPSISHLVIVHLTIITIIKVIIT